jgi:phosphoadenosine phosphosulfate reductase
MLIPSDRHTPADLELWAELEAADRIHGASDRVQQLAGRSIAEIRAFLLRGPAYLSCSFGKDSVTLADLAREAGIPCQLVYLRADPVANPETPKVRDAFLVSWPWDYREVVVDYRGAPAGLGPDALEREKDRLFFGAFRSIGLPHISGIRAEESGGRKIRMRRWGLSSPGACAPLGWWKSTDVFGWLAHRGLPVHPSYAMLGGGRWDRRHVRVDELGGARGDQFGRREWEYSYYGDVLRRLEAGQ